MFSDSSDEDGFEEGLLAEENEKDNSNVGLSVDGFKFSRGEKGRLITTHCNPRAVKGNPDMTLSLKLGKKPDEFKKFVADFFAIQVINKDTADGILIGLITNSGMSKREASYNFKIGSGRWGRLSKRMPAKKGYGLNGQQIVQADLNLLKDFLNSLDVENGYPCMHRRMKRYSAEYDTYFELWTAYVEYSPPLTENLRKMKRTTFLKYLRKVHPDFALKRAKEDECDTCIRLKMIIEDPRSSEEEQDEAQKGLEKHNGDSRVMRVAMKAAISEFGRQVLISENEITVKEIFQKSVDRLPENLDDNPLENDVVTEDNAIDLNSKPSVLLQCEDYGGNFCLPWYGSRRPCVDYYLSNLAIYMFVISNLTSGKNSVYLYDERSMGKNCDALCSLRFIYHLRLYEKARLTKALESFPKTLYIIMDNCVGQNKSQGVMMFMSFLSMSLYKRVICHYLVSGHSHMCPDRVVSHAKRSIGVTDVFEPQGFVDKMNTVISNNN